MQPIEDSRLEYSSVCGVLTTCRQDGMQSVQLKTKIQTSSSYIVWYRKSSHTNDDLKRQGN